MIKLCLNEKIEEKGLTRYILAKSTGINYQTLTKLCNGESKAIPFDILNKLCFFFDCTPGDLLIYEPDPAAISPEEFMKEVATSNSRAAQKMRLDFYHRFYKDYVNNDKESE